MVEFKGRKLGADLTSNRLRLVGQKIISGHPIIDIIQEPVPDRDIELAAKTDCELYFSISEKDALIKNLKLDRDNNLDKEKLIFFEFAVSNLGDPDNFFVDFQKINGGEEYLVCGFNKDMVREKMDYWTDCLIKPSGFKLRAMALARGYLNFCWKEEGELLCIIDISDDQTSFCFLHRDCPVAFGHVSGTLYDLEDEKSISNRYLTDLSASIQYYQMRLHHAGYTAPLSRILLSGSSASNGACLILKESNGIPTTLPSVKKALFSPETSEQAPKFLVNLGLIEG